MSRRDQVLEIARWEFLRFLKVRDLVITLVVFVAIAVAFSLVTRWVLEGEGRDRVELALSGAAAQTVTELPGTRFDLRPLELDEARRALLDGEVEGVLVVEDPEAPELLAGSRPGWLGELREALTTARIPERLEGAGIDPETFERVGAPVELTFAAVEGAPASATGALTILLFFMVGAIFVGSGVLFTAITGEKSLRITELIVSAARPQTWVDGKILGVSAYVLVYLLTYTVGMVLAAIVVGLLAGGLPTMPPLLTRPPLFLTTLLFAVLGFGFWFTFFAAVAATINDPNTSARGALILVPGLSIATGFLGLVADSRAPFFVVLSFLPPTSPSAMPVRLLLGEAAWLEVAVAALLLAATLPLMRRLAGKVFALGILMTGKEPSLREIVRWLRHA